MLLACFRKRMSVPMSTRLLKCVQSGASRPLICDVLFSFGHCYQLGRTIVTLSAKQHVEHVKNTLQSITNEGMPQSVLEKSKYAYGASIYDFRSGWVERRGVSKKQTKGTKSEKFADLVHGRPGQKLQP